MLFTPEFIKAIPEGAFVRVHTANVTTGGDNFSLGTTFDQDDDSDVEALIFISPEGVEVWVPLKAIQCLEIEP